MPKPIEIIPPKLHKRQREVMRHPARFKVMSAGRRWGKTRLGSIMCIDTAVRGGRAWWVAPSYKTANVGWRLINRLAIQIPNVSISKSDRIVTLPTGGEIAVRSADNPDSLRGEGLDFLVVDECAFVKEGAWHEALRPSLSDRRGKALLISTPKGRNWFWREFQMTQNHDDYMSWQLPTSDNPFIHKDEIAAAKRTLPQMIFDQEYQAQFLDDSNGVFRYVLDAVVDVDEIPQEGATYIIGVDLAKSHDFSVFTVINTKTKTIVMVDRFNQIDLTVQLSRLAALSQRFNNAMCIIEENFNEMFVEQAYRRDIPTQPFRTTNPSKAAAVEAVIYAFENRDIKIPDNPVLVGELQAFEMSRTMSGMVRYAAPDGMHDDCVMSLVIGWHGIANRMSAFL